MYQLPEKGPVFGQYKAQCSGFGFQGKVDRMDGEEWL